MDAQTSGQSAPQEQQAIVESLDQLTQAARALEEEQGAS